MRSSTISPLIQLFDWFGIEPYRANGIDRYGNLTAKTEKCSCILQHVWDAKGNWSRDGLIDILKFAENFYIKEVGSFPAPHQVLKEAHPYNSKNGMIQRKTGLYKSVELDYSCNFQEFGVRYLESLGVVALEKDDGLNILDEFSFSLAIPPETNVNKIHVFFTTSDGRNAVLPNLEKNREWEIRPLSFEIQENVITGIGGAYLFKKPELDEVTDCLPHQLDTYVDEVEVFVEHIDKCEQGFFVFENKDCFGDGCEKGKENICFTSRLIGDAYWAVPKSIKCDENGVFKKYCLVPSPQEVSVNYITGQCLTDKNLIDDFTFEILALLSVGLADCVGNWCACDNCAKNKLEYYRQVSKEKIMEGQATGALGDQFKILLTKESEVLVSGLKPYLALTQAFRYMQQLDCKKLY